MREAAGRVAEAVPAYEAAVQSNRRRLPVGHRDLVVSITRLAQGYYGIERYDEAIALFAEALPFQEASLGRQHPETLMTIGNLGANYRAAGRYAEAVPLLEEARRFEKQYPQLQFVDWHLVHAYVNLGATKESDAAKARALIDELVASMHTAMPKGSTELAQNLTMAGVQLVHMRAWDAAEPLLREALPIREQAQPDAWTTYNTRALLGSALLGQKKFADAEPLLLDGWRGLKEREASIPMPGRVYVVEAIERVVQFYETTGDTTKAAAFRKELEAARAATGKADSATGK
jgi:tetratricopeptide (TPR) repeat protein